MRTSAERWIISDTHFGHKNIIRFTKPDGSPIRPGYTPAPTRAFVRFRDIEHHDECLIDEWNKAVGPNHRVYMLGDFGRPLELCSRLNGKKVLILGNHDDVHDPRALGKYFEQVLAWRVWGEEVGFDYPVVASHFPLHADERKPAVRRINVHGHIHEKIITRANGMVDPWYINVCVEHTNHGPMAWDTLVKLVKSRVKDLKCLGEIEH